MPRYARPFAFVAIVLMLLGGLRLLHWLPQQLEKRSLRTWSSLEGAERALELPAIELPAFFPDDLTFPAGEILAGTVPEPLVMMHFALRRRDRIGLAIRWSTPGETPPRPRLWPTKILAERAVDLEGHAATVELATCADGRPCNRMQWTRGDWSITLVGSIAEDQLVRIGHSMVTR